MSAKSILQLLGIGMLAYIGVRAIGGNEPWFLGNINLIFHEAGHWVFFFLGDFVAALGGTLMQLLVPLVLGVYFLLHLQVYSASVMFWWFGENMMGIAIYITDASTQALPLLGGEAVTHDWHYLLGRLGWLNHDQLLGEIIHSLGVSIMFVALLIGVVVSIPFLKEKALEYVQR